jgi:hypothetical protein
MSSDRPCYTPLESAKYLVEEPVTQEASEQDPQPVARPQRGGLEHAFRWINPLVLFLLVGVAGTWYWQNQQSVSSGANKFRTRTSNPFNFLLWLKGADYTVEDVVAESQRQFQSQFENFESPFSTLEVKPIDIDSLIYNPNNAMQNDGRGY